MSHFYIFMVVAFDVYPLNSIKFCSWSSFIVRERIMWL